MVAPGPPAAPASQRRPIRARDAEPSAAVTEGTLRAIAITRAFAVGRRRKAAGDAAGRARVAASVARRRPRALVGPEQEQGAGVAGAGTRASQGFLPGRPPHLSDAKAPVGRVILDVLKARRRVAAVPRAGAAAPIATAIASPQAVAALVLAAMGAARALGVARRGLVAPTRAVEVLLATLVQGQPARVATAVRVAGVPLSRGARS